MACFWPGVKLTYDDFLLFPDDGKRHELIDGEHYVTPSRNVKHQRVLGKLFWVVQSYLEEHPVGEIFCGPLDIVLSPHDVVEPDLFYISHYLAAQVLTPQNVRGAPELVIEIASTSRASATKRSSDGSTSAMACRNTGSWTRRSTLFGCTGVRVRTSRGPSSSRVSAARYSTLRFFRASRLC